VKISINLYDLDLFDLPTPKMVVEYSFGDKYFYQVATPFHS